MGKIRLETSDWLYNAGLVGLMKIFDDSEIKYKTTENSIEFESDLLENFETAYFNFFTNAYREFMSINKIINFSYFKNVNDSEKIEKKYLDSLNTAIDYTKKKLKSNSYKSGFELLEIQNQIENYQNELKKISPKKNQTPEEIKGEINGQIKILKAVIKILKQEEVGKIIGAKNVIYDVIAKFWGDVSFLNSGKSKNDMYEEYQSYFIESVRTFVSKEKKGDYHCFACGSNLPTLGKTTAYGMAWINCIGVDIKRKGSHFWNFGVDTVICPICNLIYSCIPAGFAMIHGRGYFVNDNADIKHLISLNKTLIKAEMSPDEFENATYFKILDVIDNKTLENSERELDNIQIVKYFSNRESRPYTFNVLSKDKLAFIQRNKKRLDILVKYGNILLTRGDWLNLYNQVINRLHNNENLFSLIYEVLHEKIDAQPGISSHVIGLLIEINNDFLKGVGTEKMKHHIYYKDLEKIRKAGLDLRLLYEAKNGANKLPGISYRLLNALKTKNAPRFMDCIMNAFMYAGEEIPKEFIEGLSSPEKLQTIGYAFVLGLQGKREIKKGEEEKNEQ